MSERRWYTIREAAEYFRMSARTLYGLAARKRLPVGATIRIGRAIRFDIAAIEAGLAVDGPRGRKGGAR